MATHIKCPMRRNANIALSRVVDVQLSVLPPELWSRIFLFIRPSDRVRLMWSLAIRFPAFAHLFMTVPHLWMLWSLRTGGVRQQTCQVRYSIALWEELHAVERYLPVAVRADITTFDLWDIVNQLPSPSRDHICSMRIRVSRQSYFRYGFANLLSIVPRLSHLDLGVFRTSSITEPAVTPPTVFQCDRLAVPCNISLTSLTLHNMIIHPSSLSEERWHNITSLHAIYYREHPAEHSPLHDILLVATNLTELTVRVASILTSISRALFAPAIRNRFSTWTSRLTVLDIQGDRSHIPFFLSSLLAHPHITIRTLRIVYNCDPERADDIYCELPEFLEAALDQWDAMVVDVDSLSIELMSDRRDTGICRWLVRWKLYDWWHSDWPTNKFRQLENRFRLFVAQMILISPPQHLSIVARSQIGSIFAVMSTPCRIRELFLTGSVSMYEGLLLYIFQYHNLFPDLTAICYHPSTTDDIRDTQHILTALTMLDPPLIPVNTSRRVLLTTSLDHDTDLSFDFTRCFTWNLSSPEDSTYA